MGGALPLPFRPEDVNRTLIFDAAKRCGADFNKPGNVKILDDAIDAYERARAPMPAPEPCAPADPLTCKTAKELISHEAIVLEAYKDSVGVWTWGVGVTDASGHDVDRYRDNPQTIERCLEVYVWLLRARYIPAVLRAFTRPLTEEQFAAALSFHYNTGGILKADWVKLWNAGKVDQARDAIMNWRQPPEIIPRREKERELFFEGEWSHDGKARLIPVRKPSYQPDYRRAVRVDVCTHLDRLLA